MSVEISLSGLAKSQLLTLKGEAVSDFSPAGGIDISGARLQQSQSAIRLQNVVIDNKYKILSLLGEGGMGAVYKAHHLMLNKDVALKTFLSPNLTGDSWQRFQREAKAIASLSHNNIVQVFDFGVGDNNVPYYTMEYLRGESLAERLSRVGPLPLDQTVQLFLQVCQAMSAAHNKGIIHRDLKPANIFLSKEEAATGKSDLVKIVDFGIASLASESVDDQKLTRAGTVFGSPLYMSPEQSMGVEATIRSDIYSCGCALFETLTGSPPFRGKSALETMVQHQQKPVPQLNDVKPETEFPQRLNALLTKMLDKDPQRRFQAMTEVIAELQEIGTRYDAAHSKEGPTDEKAPESARLAEIAGSSDASPRKLNLTILIALAAILLVVGTGIYWLKFKSIGEPAKSGATPSKAANFKSALAEKGSIDTSRWFPDVKMTPHTNVATVGQQPSSGIAIKKYLQNPQADRFTARRFFFPGKASFGSLSWGKMWDAVPPYPRPGHHEALGEVIVPPQSSITLTAGEAMSANPAGFSGFGDTDLDEVQFNGKYDWSDKHLAYVGRLSGVYILNIAEIEVTDKCIQDIQKLLKLRDLRVKGTGLTGAALASLKVLPKLVTVEGTGIHSFRKVLEKLANSTELNVLIVEDCSLDDSDMKLVGSMRDLTFLDVSQNNITETGLAEICKLPRLRTLVLHGIKIPPSSFTLLQKLPKLTYLAVSKSSTLDESRLRRALPGLKIVVDISHSKFQGNFLNNEH
jgi:serine/threonine-protein kinase